MSKYVVPHLTQAASEPLAQESHSTESLWLTQPISLSISVIGKQSNRRLASTQAKIAKELHQESATIFSRSQSEKSGLLILKLPAAASL